MALTRIQPPAIADVREPNFRNIVINGDIAVSQRNTSVSSLTSSGYNTLDRYRCVIVTAGTWTQSQDTDVPTGSGFANSMKWDCTTADASLGASDLITIQQFVEGQNVQYLKKGTSDAVPLTLSFWVKSVLTGTYICEISDSDNSRSISASYTISSASTWEYKTLTFPGDTTGAFTNDNNASLTVQFCLGAGTDYTSGSLATSWGSTTTANRYVGQVNLASSTSNNFWVTGIQLEAGSVATDFEVVPYDQNLQRCQRYYYKTLALQANYPFGFGQCYSSTSAGCLVNFPVIMRTNPSALEQSGTATDYQLYTSSGSVATCSAVPAIAGVDTTNLIGAVNFTVASGVSAGDVTQGTAVNTSAYLAWSAEL